MKSWLYLAFLFCLIFSACDDGTAADPEKLNKYVLIEAEFEFDNDLVQIYFDDEQLLNSRITTNYTVSLAWGSELMKISSRDHVLKTSIPEYGISKTVFFIPDYDTTSISIRFQKESGNIEYIEREGIFLRD